MIDCYQCHVVLPATMNHHMTECIHQEYFDFKSANEVAKNDPFIRELLKQINMVPFLLCYLPESLKAFFDCCRIHNRIKYLETQRYEDNFIEILTEKSRMKTLLKEVNPGYYSYCGYNLL